MNILMMTNTYLPHVGGVARSVEVFTHEFRRRGHRVLVVAPQFEGAPADEEGVLRVPAIQNFNGSDFSVRLPIPGLLASKLDVFKPDVVHSHHPFLLGDTALRIAAVRDVPLVFTHHTMYERYTHYVPGSSRTMRDFAIRLATAYANLCHAVIAPSESIAAILRERGVDTPVHSIPTGIQSESFVRGDGAAVRRRLGIEPESFVVGHVGRLAEEKNLPFLARAVALFLKRHAEAHFLVVGSGPSEEAIRETFRRHRVDRRLHMLGSLRGQDLADAYHAMDVFAFASQSETQGLVLAEAMTAGVPVVAVDAPGAREVVDDGQNGRLLPHENLKEFAAALRWVATLAPERRAEVVVAARRTAEEYSLPRCAQRVLRVYEGLHAHEPERREVAEEDDAWAQALRRMEAEWELWSSRAEAAAKAVSGRGRRRWRPNLEHIEGGLRRARRAVSRSEWLVRLLGLSRSETTAADHGLIMIQVDGLSREQLEHALARRQMPFLRRLLQRQGYVLGTHYSGLPSTTPAIQGELFYGVKMAVPAFSFRDGATREIVRMYQQDAALRRQRILGKLGSGLIHGGSSYSNIYTGGAQHAQLCSATTGLRHLLRQINPLAALLIAVAYFPSIVRALAATAIEVGLALVDFFRGILHGRDVLPELLFVPRRVGVAVLLRDILTIGASMDAARGIPVIHVNFLGYDEQAHLRGPSSLFAHWTLSGIDRAIKRIYRSARRSSRRDYEVWMYSDHGQEATDAFSKVAGRPIERALSEVMRRHGLSGVIETDAQSVARSGQTGVWQGWRRRRKRVAPDAGEPESGAAVAAMGPLGFLYLDAPLDNERLDALAAAFVAEAQVPMVVRPDGPEAAKVWCERGVRRLPEDAAELLGRDHPFLDTVTLELIALASHHEAGELTLLGWRPGGRGVSFVDENGAHGGPGPQETGGFYCVPRVAPVPREKPFLRPLDLRKAALRWLEGPDKHERPEAAVPAREPGTLRLMTYNVHSCIGLDGRLSPHRVAKLIAHYEPDVVALQELDVRRPRTGEVDQAHLIAQALQMEHHFHPAFRVEEERYGDAILSHLPMTLVRAGPLPGAEGALGREPRGALWVKLEVDGRPLHVINTHLGLSGEERMRQAEALLGEWLEAAARDEPVVLVGDFNALPGSKVYKRLTRRLRDAQRCVRGHLPRRTLWGRLPLGRIDHVFCGDSVEVKAVQVPRTDLARVASDHLPLIVDLRLLTGPTEAVTAAPPETAASAEAEGTPTVAQR